MTDLTLRCACGHLRGVVSDVSPRTSNRCVCYCRDCRAFARWLGTGGLLDAAGGSDILQVAPWRVRLETGTDALACMRLSPRGLHRWYAGCCRTPVANTHPRVPFAGMPVPIVRDGADGRPRDAITGPPRFRLYEEVATGPLPPGAPPKAGLLDMLRVTTYLASWVLGARGKVNPFFQPGTRAPRKASRELTAGERAALG